jgi:hypothetical protein
LAKLVGKTQLIYIGMKVRRKLFDIFGERKGFDELYCKSENLYADAVKNFQDLGENPPKIKVDIISMRRYEPQFCSQNITVFGKEPPKLEKFNIFKQTIATILNPKEKFDMRVEFEYGSNLGHLIFCNKFHLNNATNNNTSNTLIIPFFSVLT